MEEKQGTKCDGSQDNMGETTARERDDCRIGIGKYPTGDSVSYREARG